MYKTLLLCNILFLTSCEEITSLHRIGGEDCVIDDYGKLHVGYEAQRIACDLGKTKFINNVEFCIGGEMPSQEVCDGKDNDCDGNTDDIKYAFLDFRNECYEAELGVCRFSDYECVEGQMVCTPPSYSGSEICDGLDNDCDGLTDEDDPDLVLVGEEWVYNGPPNSLNIGECRAGRRTCSNGEEILFGMRTPVDEICSNGDDDDCDGLTDEVDTINSVDYLLSIDNSGSMDPIKQTIQTAICEWARNGYYSQSRFAIISFGIISNGPIYMTVVTDFTDAQTACNALGSFLSRNERGSVELQPDSVIKSFIDQDPMKLSWSSNTRKAIVFTDEAVQTLYHDPVAEMINSCENNNFSLSAFLTYGTPDYNKWMEMTQNCAGFLDTMSYNSEEIKEQLEYWFGGVC